MGSPASYRTVEIMQQCKFGFDVEFVQNLVDTWSVVKDYAYIVHDQEDKEDHIHLMIRFNTVVPTKNILAKLQGRCENQHLQGMKKWNSAIAYLTHSNAPDKYQYPDSAVISNYEWQKDRDAAITDKVQMQLLVDAIEKNECRGYNIHEFVPITFVMKYKRQIDIAINYHLNELEQKGQDREMEVLYFTGASGTGKTTYAKKFCERMRFSCFVSSSSNDVLDGYQGQDCIILDDFRPSDWKIADLLKFLDNNTNSRAKSRYSNKSMVYCKCIIITSVLSVNDLYQGLKDHDSEPIKQLHRRFSGVFTFTDDTITIHEYDEKTQDFTDLYESFKNPFSHKSREALKEKKRRMFGVGLEPVPIGDDDDLPFGTDYALPC